MADSIKNEIKLHRRGKFQKSQLLQGEITNGPAGIPSRKACGLVYTENTAEGVYTKSEFFMVGQSRTNSVQHSPFFQSLIRWHFEKRLIL